MSTKVIQLSRLLSIIAFATAAFLPLWRIEIWAPQYPEGLSMQIGSYWMSGDISQINILNHYIGMKHIVPSEILELKLIPWLYGTLVAFGAFAVFSRSRLAFMIWFASVVGCVLIGMVDFYRWGYDYGHNLDPNAPIKIPGMTYQPPLIGSKILLNIHSYSLPDFGGYLFGVALLLGVIGLIPHVAKSK